MSKKRVSIVETKCKICSADFSLLPQPGKKLQFHLRKNHQITPEDYTIQFNHGGIIPSCPICGLKPNCYGYTFKTYCELHSKEAMKKGGQLGGVIKQTWNKGQTKKTNPTIAKQAKAMLGQGNPFYGMTHTPKIKEIINRKLDFSVVTERFYEMFNTLKLLSTDSDYNTQYDLLKIHCETCSNEWEESFFNLQRCSKCRICFPNASREQVDVNLFVQNLGFKTEVSTRKIIHPLELDVFIPERNLAIEYHGLFWHSGGLNNQFESKRHRAKYEACKEKGIKLIQIFGDEWKLKNDICKSMISNAFGIHELKLNARDCEIIMIDSKISKPFLNDTHVAGYIKASVHVGIKHPVHGLVGVMTLRKPRQKKYSGLIEVARMAFKLNTCVRGAASKFIKFVERTLSNEYKGILSYADLRYGEGNVYSKCGFIRHADVKTNFWYTDNSVRYDRFKFKADKSRNMTEKQVAAEANVKRIEGCGNAVYIKLFGE